MSKRKTMTRWTSLVVQLAAVALFVSAVASIKVAWAEVLPQACGSQFPLDTGDPDYPVQWAVVCQPPADAWNGVLVLYAHGYVRPAAELVSTLPEEVFDQIAQAAAIMVPNGYALAASSFRKNGYAVEQAVGDLNALLEHYRSIYDEPSHILIAGASEGGLIATELVEKFARPDGGSYDGGLALCGPLSGANRAAQYFGNVAVIFRHLFPAVLHDLPLFPVEGDDALWDGVWNNRAPLVKQAVMDDLSAGGAKTEKLYRITGIARPDTDDPNYAELVADAVADILAYTVRGSNDIDNVAGGIPFDNENKWYRDPAARPFENLLLNLSIGAQGLRVSGDPVAQAYMQVHYEPSGRLKVPLITRHTRRDEIVPYLNEWIYFFRSLGAGGTHLPLILPVSRYGHCEFETGELLAAFGLLLLKTGAPITF